MSKEVKIKNGQGLFKKALDLGKICDSLGCGLGAMDEYFRISMDVNGGPLVFFNPDCVGRGVQIYDYTSKSECRLVMNSPSAPQDVELLYRLIGVIAEQWKAGYVTMDGEKVLLSELESRKAKDHESNIKILSNARQLWKGNITVYGAYWPLVFTLDEMDAFSGKDGYDKFGKTLHDMLSLEAFYTEPNIYIEDDKVCCAYIPLVDTISIFPTTPDPEYKDHSGKVAPFDKLLVILKDDNGLYLEVDFKEFMSKIPQKYVKRYDEEHVQVLPVPTDELYELFED